MSPEQVQGEASVDYRSDLWAMGVLTFECLVGKRPFEHEALGQLAEQICKHPPHIPSQHFALPLEFDAWFAKAMAKKPEERFASARDMVEALERALRPILGPEGRPSGTWSEADDRESSPQDAPSSADDANATPSGATKAATEKRIANAQPTAARRSRKPQRLGVLRLFFDGMLVCLVTLILAVGIFFARSTLANLAANPSKLWLPAPVEPAAGAASEAEAVRVDP